MENILIYDIEVFAHDNFAVFMNLDGEVVHISRSCDGHRGLRGVIKDKLLCGYNNFWYDDHVLAAMLRGADPQSIKKLNDAIIGGAKQYPQKGFQSLDCFQQIDVSSPGLKKIEANMGKKILESSVSFDIDRPLTEEEYNESVDYCIYDCRMTLEVYKMRINSYFKPKESLVEMVGQGQRWNTTTLSANALLGDGAPLVKWSDIRLNSDDIRDQSMLDLVPVEVKELWLNSVDDKGKVTIHEFDCEIEFGFGGLHGVHKSQKRFENVVLLDVVSMYPNIILNINALGKATDRYKQILDERTAIKHTDKVKSDALKLILNSVYGNLKSQYSALNNPKAALSVCVYGQIALYELGRRISKVGTLVQLNTDGIAFVPHGDYEGIWKQWEEDFNLQLEEDRFDLFLQKNVNSYIGVKDGKVKVKGGDVGRYHGDSLFKNNSARILDIALVDKVLYNKSVIDTLIENLDNPKLYQYVLQAGHTYQGTFDEKGNKYQKINRVFATRKGDLCLYKKRMDDGLVKFPDVPEKMYLWNDDISKIEKFERILDINHYLSIIDKRLEGWAF